MKRWTDKVGAVVLIGSGLVFYLVILGLRGTGRAGIALAERVQQANQALLGGHAMEVVASAHPLVDVAAIAVAAVGQAPLDTFGVVSAAAVSLAIPAVWQMAQAGSDKLGAGLASALFFGLPAVAGVATISGPAAISLALWCWVLRLSTKSTHRWPTTVALGLCSGALALSWAPAILWLVGWPVMVVCVSGFWRPTDHDDAGGMIAPTGVPVALVVAALAAVVVPSVFFLAIGIDPTQLGPAWGTYLSHGLVADWPPVILGGHTFGADRPPLTTGLIMAAFELSPPVVLGAIAALMLPVTKRFSIFAEQPATTRGFAMPRSFSLFTLVFLLGLPWALRTTTIAQTPILVMAAPVVAVLAGSILGTLVEMAAAVLARRQITRRVRRGLVGVAAGLFLVPVFIETVAIHPFEESYYNWFAGSVPAAIAAGYPASRQDVLPVEVAASAANKVGSRKLDAGPYKAHFQAYIRNGDVGPLNFADTPADAQARFDESRHGSGAKRRVKPAKYIRWGPEDVDVFHLEFISEPTP